MDGGDRVAKTASGRRIYRGCMSRLGLDYEIIDGSEWWDDQLAADIVWDRFHEPSDSEVVEELERRRRGGDDVRAA